MVGWTLDACRTVVACGLWTKTRRELKRSKIKNVTLVEIRICYRKAFNFKYNKYISRLIY